MRPQRHRISRPLIGKGNVVTSSDGNRGGSSSLYYRQATIRGARRATRRKRWRSPLVETAQRLGLMYKMFPGINDGLVQH